MYPILFKLFGIPIYSYGLMLAISVLVCIVLVLRRAPSIGIQTYHILDLSLYVLISGIIGARLLYVILNWSYYINRPVEILLLNKGGLAFYGGFILALLVGIGVVKKRKIPAGKIVDVASLYIPLGHSIGRIGCFLNGCCYGKPTAVWWAVQFPPNSLAAQHFGPNHFVHPTQIYSSVVNLVIFLILALKSSHKRFNGEILLDYMILYGTARFILEFFRADNPMVLWELNVFQLISIVMVITGIVLRFLLRVKHARGYSI